MTYYIHTHSFLYLYTNLAPSLLQTYYTKIPYWMFRQHVSHICVLINFLSKISLSSSWIHLMFLLSTICSKTPRTFQDGFKDIVLMHIINNPNRNKALNGKMESLAHLETKMHLNPQTVSFALEEAHTIFPSWRSQISSFTPSSISLV